MAEMAMRTAATSNSLLGMTKIGLRRARSLVLLFARPHMSVVGSGTVAGLSSGNEERPGFRYQRITGIQHGTERRVERTV